MPILFSCCMLKFCMNDFYYNRNSYLKFQANCCCYLKNWEGACIKWFSFCFSLRVQTQAGQVGQCMKLKSPRTGHPLQTAWLLVFKIINRSILFPYFCSCSCLCFVFIYLSFFTHSYHTKAKATLHPSLAPFFNLEFLKDSLKSLTSN